PPEDLCVYPASRSSLPPDHSSPNRISLPSRAGEGRGEGVNRQNRRRAPLTPAQDNVLGNFLMPEMRMIEAVRAAIGEEMERDDRVLVMGEDVGRKGGVFGATDGLYAKFGEARVLDKIGRA